MDRRLIIVLACILFSASNLFAQVTFQKQLDSLNGLFCLEQTSDGTFWLGTFLGKIIRLDANGEWMGGYTLQKGDTAATRFVYDLEKTPDGGVWALFDRNNSNTALDDYLILAKIAPDGLPVWQTPVHYGEVLHWAHNRLSSDPSGNAYALSARFSSPGSGQPSRIILAKVDPVGDVLWSHAYFNNGINYPRTLQRLNNGSFLICGNGQLAASYGFVLRLSSDGDVLWSKRYNRFLFKAFAELPGGDWVFAATEAGPLPQAACVLRMNPSGDIIWAKRLNMPYALNWLPGLTVTPAGDLVIFNYETQKEQAVADMIGLSAAGDFQWATRYDLCHNYGVSAGIITNDGGIAGLRYRSGGHLFLKTDAQGHCQNCTATGVVIQAEDIMDTPNDFAWQVENRTPPFPASSDFLPFQVSVSDFCGNQKPVTGISVFPAEICTFQDLAVASNGSGQADEYDWVFPGGSPGSASGYGAVNGIQFAAPGLTTITLATETGFCTDTFTIEIKVRPGPEPFDLGKDTTVCGSGISITLDATTVGATDYTWNDGSSGPVREVLASGEYIATASTGSCQATDTVRLQILDNITVVLPGDTTICGIDTLWLDATTPDADSYQWNDGYKTARRPVISQGYYAVTAYRGNCSASDFVAVNPFPTPSPLPEDTVLCGDEPVTFTVGESLAGAIRWNGEPGYAQFTFADTGWVRRIIEYQNCRFVDSVYVRRVECRDGFAYYAPNVFSPNGDGENDDFEIFGDDMDVLLFHVFDRWGNLLLSEKDAKPALWNGSGSTRSLQPGVYGWIAQVRQHGREGWISGDVLLIR